MGGSPVLAGKLDRRVRLQRPTISQDTTGQALDSWTTVATVWASIEPVRGRQLFEAQKVTSEADLRIRIRFRADVDATWRIQQDDTATSPATTKTYRIIAPPERPNDGRRELHLLCKYFDTGEPT